MGVKFVWFGSVKVVTRGGCFFRKLVLIVFNLYCRLCLLGKCAPIRLVVLF